MNAPLGLDAGSVLGPFRIERQLGQGGMASVYRSGGPARAPSWRRWKGVSKGPRRPGPRARRLCLPRLPPGGGRRSRRPRPPRSSRPRAAAGSLRPRSSASGSPLVLAGAVGVAVLVLRSGPQPAASPASTAVAVATPHVPVAAPATPTPLPAAPVPAATAPARRDSVSPAARALGRIGPPAREAVPALAAMSRDSDVIVSCEARAALESIGP